MGFLISKGQLVFFNIGLAESLVFTGLEGEIARSRSQKIFYSTCTNLFVQEEFSDTCFQIQKDLHSNKLKPIVKSQSTLGMRKILAEMKRGKMICVVGKTSAARWYPGTGD